MYRNNAILPGNQNIKLKEIKKLPIENNECIITWKDGSEYIGECKNKELNGYGVYTFPDKSVYSGFWKHSCKHGLGTLRYNDGTSYKGTFINDMISGDGVLSYDITDEGKQIYIGEFRNGLMNGYGKLYYHNKTTGEYELEYIGYFKNNTFNGIGMCFHKNGNKFYEGHFAKGKPCGEGILYDEEGEKREASYYISGEQQKDLSQTRHFKLIDKLQKKIKFPMYHIHHNI